MLQFIAVVTLEISYMRLKSSSEEVRKLHAAKHAPVLYEFMVHLTILLVARTVQGQKVGPSVNNELERV